MSVGLPEINNVLLQAVNTTVLTYGIPIINAAGNDGSDACTNTPARSTYVISVGAVDAYDQVTAFSNFGRCVDVFAPGLRIKAASLGGDNLYAVLSGTSQAAPIVTGIAAMLMVDNAHTSWTDIRDFINTAYYRNATTRARIIQMPPLTRILDQKSGNNIVDTLCSMRGRYLPYLAPSGSVAPLAALPQDANARTSAAGTSLIGEPSNGAGTGNDNTGAGNGNTGGSSTGLDTTTPT